MKKIRIEPYKTWSGGAKRLGQRAGILRATKRQVAKHGDFDVIINWGRSERRFNGNYINEPAAVCVAGDKKATFLALKEAGVPRPDFTSDKSVAQDWLLAGDSVVVRRLLRASAGRGIVLVHPDDSAEQTLPDAPLYVKYTKKKDEYRVHVVRGEVIDVQQKKRCLSTPDEAVNWQIRNHHNGWVFARDDVNAPGCVLDAARRAVVALGLDFGAVDVGYNSHADECVVYEVNTAPGVEGTTVESYFSAFKNLLPVLAGGRYKSRRTARGY
jgi:glutathione synthase/RimK-type ligase-like ATP-grasp enzyme